MQEPELSDSDLQALTTYVFGTPTYAQIRQVDALLAGERCDDVLREMVALRELGGVSPDRPDYQAAWQQVASQIVPSATPEPTKGRPSQSPFRWTTVGSVVAACGLVLAVLVGVQEARTPTQQSGDTPAYAVATRSAQRTDITLADGTRVLLNVASRIEIPKDFGVGQRKVKLYGQAVFRVAHNPDVPFSVDAAGTNINVLGTEFGVRAYTGEQPTSIAVRSGRVAVGRAVLQAGDLAHAVRGEAPVVTHKQNIDHAFDFTIGQLVLNNARLQDVIPDLNRWYDVDLRLGDAHLNDRRVYAVLKSGGVESLAEIFTKAFDLRVERHGRVITLHER